MSLPSRQPHKWFEGLEPCRLVTLSPIWSGEVISMFDTFDQPPEELLFRDGVALVSFTIHVGYEELSFILVPDVTNI